MYRCPASLLRRGGLLASKGCRTVGEDLPAGVTLTLDTGAQSVHASVNPAQLGLALRALVTNAVEAMPEGGHLTIRASEVEVAPHLARSDLDAGSYVALDVVDDGVGMTPETRDRLFELFFTTKEGHEKDTETGLGLPAVW